MPRPNPQLLEALLFVCFLSHTLTHFIHSFPARLYFNKGRSQGFFIIFFMAEDLPPDLRERFLRSRARSSRKYLKIIVPPFFFLLSPPYD